MDRLTVTFICDGESLVAVDPAEAEANLELERDLHPEPEPVATTPTLDAYTGKPVRADVQAAFDEHLRKRRKRRLRTYAIAATPARRIYVSSAAQRRPRERRARRATGGSSRDGPDSDEPDPPLGGSGVTVSRVCLGCGASIEHLRRQAITCGLARCRKRLQRRRQSANGSVRENSNGRTPLRPRELAELRDLVARARLEQDGGYERIERLARDLDRFLDPRSAAA
jgi:hypothetical protein